MKRTFLTFFVITLIALFFNSCSTDVDLYAEYKHITVVYGLLDYKKDTNYVKINKAFLGPGNALDIALIADSCNYPGKLNAKIKEYRASAMGNNYQLVREFPLDTITIHNKEQGIFYAPDQKVYYTTEKVHSDTKEHKYRYALEIDRGDTILTSQTDVVGGNVYNITSSVLNFATNTDLGYVNWIPFPNAVVYEVIVTFNWMEQKPGQDTVFRNMKWSLGTYSESDLNLDNGQLKLSYKTSNFYNALGATLGADTLDQRVDRFIGTYPLSITIAAGGLELYNFISVNGPSSSIVQTIPEYTNINGGYGVFSSRNMVEKKEVRMSSQSFTGLVARNWGFRQGK